MSVTIYLRIHDERDFRQAAAEQYKKDGPPSEDAGEYLDPEKTSLGECAIMLLDPGTSPAGSSILESVAGDEYDD